MNITKQLVIVISNQ